MTEYYLDFRDYTGVLSEPGGDGWKVQQICTAEETSGGGVWILWAREQTEKTDGQP